jgi:hypothetical protein
MAVKYRVDLRLYEIHLVVFLRQLNHPRLLLFRRGGVDEV